MAESAILYDSSLCSACKGCQVQCKQWNGMPSTLTKNGNTFTGSYQSMPDLNGDTLLLMKYSESSTETGVQWAFTRRSCFHCTEAWCEKVCPVGAYTHLENGTVKHDNTKCIGCRYCMTACPFGVPQFREQFGVTSKCTLCEDRVLEDRKPACVKTCPASALSFGPRGEMIDKGKARVEELKKAGFTKAELYGETEMGGMHVLHVAKYGLEAHGYIRDPKPPVTAQLHTLVKPLTGVGLLGMLAVVAASYVGGSGYKRSEDELRYDPVLKDTVRKDTPTKGGE